MLSNRSISRVAGYAGGKIITTRGKIMTIGGLLCAGHSNPLDAVERIPGSSDGAHRPAELNYCERVWYADIRFGTIPGEWKRRDLRFEREKKRPAILD